MAAMLAGVVTYVVAFAWIGSLPNNVGQLGPCRWCLAVETAGTVRAILGPLMFFWPDVQLGMISIAVSNRLMPALHAQIWHGSPAFGGVYVITLLQGMFVSVTILVLAALIWALRTVRDGNRIAMGARGRDG
jgi:hypothetical protein